MARRDMETGPANTNVPANGSPDSQPTLARGWFPERAVTVPVGFYGPGSDLVSSDSHTSRVKIEKKIIVEKLVHSAPDQVLVILCRDLGGIYSDK